MLASPWFAGVHGVLAALPSEHAPSRHELNALARSRGIASGGGEPIEFVSPDAERGDEPYERRIYRTGAVATRDESLHDLFNALVWLAFPRAKAALNRLHYEEIARLGDASPTRGTARDVATLFDEGGMIVSCSDASLAELLRNFCWRELFWRRRAEVAERMRFFVFGHAILEHALAPYKAVTAKALILDVDAGAFACAEGLIALLDARAAAHFEQPEARLSTRTLHPLPVLGIPGWTPDNEAAAYYDDATVFRPGRKKLPPEAAIS